MAERARRCSATRRRLFSDRRRTRSHPHQRALAHPGWPSTRCGRRDQLRSLTTRPLQEQVSRRHRTQQPSCSAPQTRLPGRARWRAPLRTGISQAGSSQRRTCARVTRYRRQPTGNRSASLRPANLVRVALEDAVTLESIQSRSEALQTLQSQATEILMESYELPAVRPKSRIIRASVLGMIITEQARLLAAEGNQQEAREQAWLARVCLKPYSDLFELDADESPAHAIRYGEALHLSGAQARAIAAWRRSRDRLALMRGEQLPAVSVLSKRIGAPIK